MSEDRNLTCVECNSTFVYSADDQQFHASKGYTEPKRCPAAELPVATAPAEAAATAAAEYSSGGSYGDSSYGGGRKLRSQREMFPATCSECNQQTQFHSSRAATSPSTAAIASASAPQPHPVV